MTGVHNDIKNAEESLWEDLPEVLWASRGDAVGQVGAQARPDVCLRVTPLTGLEDCVFCLKKADNVAHQAERTRGARPFGVNTLQSISTRRITARA